MKPHFYTFMLNSLHSIQDINWINFEQKFQQDSWAHSFGHINSEKHALAGAFGREKHEVAGARGFVKFWMFSKKAYAFLKTTTQSSCMGF
jgi:hypothetical protein